MQRSSILVVVLLATAVAATSAKGDDRNFPRQRAAHGYRTWDVVTSLGITTPGADEDKVLFEGFGAGAALQLGARYFPNLVPFTWRKIPSSDTRHRRYFLGLSYSMSFPGAEKDRWSTDTPSMRAHTGMFEMGLTGPILGKDSYGYFLFGLGSMWTSADSCGSSCSRDDANLAARFGAGGVIGVSARWGIVVQAYGDLLIPSEENGMGLVTLSVGFNYEFP